MNTRKKLYSIAVLLLAIFMFGCSSSDNPLSFTEGTSTPTTPTKPSTPTDPTPDPVVFGSVTIGTQVWMAKNLNVTTYRNGDPITHAETADQWMNAASKGEGAWCYYENDTETGKVYGILYNWYAVIDPRGLAPAGWHLPSDADWQTLEKYLGLNPDDAELCLQYRGINQGGKLKEHGTSHWASPNMLGTEEDSGFNALPAGYRTEAGAFTSLGNLARIWTTNNCPIDPVQGVIREMSYSESAVYRGGSPKGSGLSVRCIKD
jgi:uncharacterized protein (TIGR02145 family)